MAEAFARRLGVEPVLVVVEAHDDLIPALRSGKGDVIAASLTVTEAREKLVAFARSTFAVSELVVGREGMASPPRAPEDLAGREVHVRPSSAYADSLAEVEGVRVVPVPEHLDTAEVLSSVAAGERPLTVADSHIFEAVSAYEPKLRALFALSEGREISWAVRKDAPDLRAAIDRFRTERALVGAVEPICTGDLDQIRERGVLRVLTRNNPVTYFLHRGRAFGFEHELVEMMAEALDVRLQMVVPPSREALVPWLLEGKGDLIAASMTITPDRQQKVAFSTPYLYVDEVVVGPAGAAPPESLDALSGEEIHVRRSSSGWETLGWLEEARSLDVERVAAPEARETELLLADVAKGRRPLTIADTHILQVERAYGLDLTAGVALPTRDGVTLPKPPPRADEDRGSKALAFALRPANERLKAWVDDFVRKRYRGRKYNIFRQRYFENRRRIRRMKTARVDRTGRISPYDDIFKKYGRRYGLDWRLLAAQAYVESGFDPEAKSWVGAEGLFQVMPRTGRSLGFTDLESPEQGTHAGVKYLARLLRRFDPELPFRERVWFALAAYNVGLGHVYDARRLAREKGWDPETWFGHVEQAMLLLSRREYARRARHGYARGREPVAYVAHIRDRYRAYQRATRESEATPATAR
jgi:membrane-bound lytic murein transglycosylase F